MNSAYKRDLFVQKGDYTTLHTVPSSPYKTIKITLFNIQLTISVILIVQMRLNSHTRRYAEKHSQAYMIAYQGV